MSQQNKDNTQLFIILGWVCTAMSLLFIPILFGAGGVIFGYYCEIKDKYNMEL